MKKSSILHGFILKVAFSVFTTTAWAAPAAFDATIKNNSLALNPEQTLAVASYSDSS